MKRVRNMQDRSGWHKKLALNNLNKIYKKEWMKLQILSFKTMNLIQNIKS